MSTTVARDGRVVITDFVQPTGQQVTFRECLEPHWLIRRVHAKSVHYTRSHAKSIIRRRCPPAEHSRCNNFQSIFVSSPNCHCTIILLYDTNIHLIILLNCFAGVVTFTFILQAYAMSPFGFNAIPCGFALLAGLVASSNTWWYNVQSCANSDDTRVKQLHINREKKRKKND